MSCFHGFGNNIPDYLKARSLTFFNQRSDFTYMKTKLGKSEMSPSVIQPVEYSVGCIWKKISWKD